MNSMENAPKKLERLATAAFVREKKAAILLEWEELARKKVTAAEEQSRLALRDSLPQFIDQLSCTLEADDPSEEADANAEVAREHGEDRAAQEEYNLDQVIYEYQLLRGVINRRLDLMATVTNEIRHLVHDYIDRGVRKAAVRYTEIESAAEARQKADLEASRLEAERANLAKTSFLANMSHEIRTPLGAIMGFIGLMRDPDVHPTEISNHLSVIDRNSNHLLRIVDDILDLAKVESGKMTIEKIEFSLIQFLAEFASFAGLKARENGIVFEFKADSLLPETICSDPTRLRQILSNVVGNAIKFTEKGKVELAVAYIDKQLVFRVTDTGRGISDEQRPLLFQAFAQADSSTTRKYGGTGLGLVLTKKLCEALGGGFKLAESVIGKGSTFESSVPVEIPKASRLVPVHALEIRSAPEASRTSSVDLSNMKVLLVEDSPDNQLLVRMMLAKVGIAIDIANDGADGIEAATSKNYDVVLMDIQMPNMDGHEAVKTLRAKGYAGPIVALTAHAMKVERERAEQSGFSHFLTKPIDRKSLIDLIESLQSLQSLRD
jgi:signal transduction histidine kinase/CheY-like chemotaxis protein